MLGMFAQGVEFEFDCLGDAIWKFNGQIDEIKKEELAKLDTYFPTDTRSRALRWKYEGYKVDFFFPVALNYSFVTLVFIELETKLMRLCEIIHDSHHSVFRVRDVAGRGLDRCLLYIERVTGVRRENLKYWEQISALQRIRNCIVHTAGIVGDTRDADSLRNLVRDEAHLASHHRGRAAEPLNEGSNRHPGLSLIKYQGTDKLMIGRDYSLVVNSYARDFLLDLIERLGGQSGHGETVKP